MIASNCIIIKGAKRSLILDLQHQKIYFIPNEIRKLLEKGAYQKIDKGLLKELEEKDILFTTEFSKSGFLPLNTAYCFPSKIKKSILDISSDKPYNIQYVIKQLEELNCRYIEIRFFTCTKATSLIKEVLNLLIESTIECVDLILPFQNDEDILKLIDLKKKNPRARNIFVHSCPNNMNQSSNELIFSSQVIKDNSHCGIISSFYFSPNIDAYTESVNYNSCLNQKISVDINGDIKNCPSMTKSYGNIKDTT
jgi:SPASM domain peptide maturase of grasp-with-spasm system